MYYRRWVSDGILNLLKPRGALNFLVQIARDGELPQYPGIRLDLQLRNEEVAQESLSLYAGKTAILKVAFRRGGVIEFSAADFYEEQPCAGALRSYPAGGLPDNLEEGIRGYLNEVCIGLQWLRGEGKLQNDLARRFSVDSLPTDRFVIFDSEPNVGGRDGRDLLETIQPFYRRRLKELAQETGSRFYQPAESESMGSEADFFAIGLDNTLYIIEIKDGSARSADMYFLPRQIGVYRSLWLRCAPSLTDDINRLIEQKEELGLIPQSSAGRRLKREGVSVVPVVIVGGQMPPTPEVRRRYAAVRAHLRACPLPETKEHPLAGLLEFRSVRGERCELEPLGW